MFPGFILQAVARGRTLFLRVAKKISRRTRLPQSFPRHIGSLLLACSLGLSGCLFPSQQPLQEPKGRSTFSQDLGEFKVQATLGKYLLSE